ncbi:MAG: class I SAM-dependent methyltransferase [Microcoleaceae cyanobacterium]
MDNNYILDSKNNSVVDAIIHELSIKSSTFKSKIADTDEMYSYDLKEIDSQINHPALLSYYLLGYSIFSTVQQIVNYHFGNFDKLSNFLDFASGYGRFTRYLIQALSPQKIWACDIYPEAVQFQTEYLGVNGIHSCLNPQDYSVNQPFDCILVSSLFSHLPEPSFKQWMEKLYDLTHPQGLLIFSVLDEITTPIGVEMPPSGFLFSADTSESHSLNKQDYGTTYVTETYIRNLLNKLSQGKANIYRFPQGLGQYQDLYIVTQNTDNNLSKFTLHQPPRGSLDSCYLTSDGILCLSGWGADFNPGGEVKAIEVIINKNKIYTLKPSVSRPDVADIFQRPDLINCGWHCQLQPDQFQLNDTILVKVTNNFGIVWVIDAEIIQWLIPRHRLELQRAVTESQLQQAEAKIEAMERTIFWRIRRKCFKLLGRFGLYKGESTN